jgi:hypothetical protein
MEIAAVGPERDFEDELAEGKRYGALLSEVNEISLAAQRVLYMTYVKPEHAVLILKDCLEKIEEMCSI